MDVVTLALARKYTDEKSGGKVTITGVTLNNDYTLTMTWSDGYSYTTPVPIRGERGLHGEDGVSVISIVKTATGEQEDTFTVSFSDGSASTFTMPNGKYYYDQSEVIYSNVKALMLSSMTVIKDMTSTSITLTPEAETRYIYGELTSLTITSLPEVGIVDVMFDSGATATVLDLPINVIMPEWFIVQPNTKYEINFADGMGVVMEWPQ